MSSISSSVGKRNGHRTEMYTPYCTDAHSLMENREGENVNPSSFATLASAHFAPFSLTTDD